MLSNPPSLTHIAAIQSDLKSIRDLFPDQWDSDRILNFARAIAIRSTQIQDGILKPQAEAKIDESLAKVIERQFNSGKPVAVDQIQARTHWAMICHCLNLMEESALHQFAAKMGSWHKELRSALTMLDEDSVQTLAFALQTMIANADLRDLDLIDDLPGHQRSQVYARLTRSQITELGRLKSCQ